MGADQNLIRAAAQLGPKPFDYSGIMKGIGAIGQYISTKKAIANEIMSQGEKAFQSIPSGVFEGNYGDYNLDFLTSAKQEYFKANQIIAKSPAFTKKYKNAVKTINNIKTVLEKNKAGLIKWEQIQNDVLNGDKMTNVSAGIGSEANNRLLDIVLNYETGDMNKSITLTSNGPVFYDDELERNINIDDILIGYKGKSKLLVSSANTFDSIIDKYGKRDKENNTPFDSNAVKTKINTLINTLGATSLDDIRSFAYDYQHGDLGSYTQSQSELILKLNDEELIRLNPGKDPSTLGQIKENLLADAYNFNNASDLEADLKNWLFGIVQDKWTSTKIKTKEGNLQLSLMNINNSTMSVDANEKAVAIDQINKKGSWSIDGTQFTWDEKAGQWKYQELVDGNYKMQPVPGDPQGEFEAGSSEALLYRFNYDEGIKRALAKAGLIEVDNNTQTQAQTDTSQMQIEGDSSFVLLPQKTDTILK